MDKVTRSIREFLAHRFNLQEDKDDEAVIIKSVSGNVDFIGANLFALIFAIFIASIGLNVNSTAVIIGAMLISPIMGPVMGIGLGVGINDLTLVKKGLKNLLIATIIGVIVSTIYFLITPLHDAQSELLARTSPSIWDVFIAFFGGAAGMVAASRKEKSNVIPGVAIATALMPPLCTVGFGIAGGDWLFVLGALYLYFINSVFIAIATFLMSRYLKMKKHHQEDAGQEKKVTRYIIAIVIITIVPSIFLAYRIVDKSIFETNAKKFVSEQFDFKNTQVVSRTFKYGNKNKAIDLLLIGTELSKAKTDSITQKLDDYQLQNVQLNIRQGLNAKQQIDLAQIKTSILEDVFSHSAKSDSVAQIVPRNKALPSDTLVLAELKVLYPEIRSFGINQTVIYHADNRQTDTIKVATLTFKTTIKRTDQLKLQKWLGIRYRYHPIKLMITKEPK